MTIRSIAGTVLFAGLIWSGCSRKAEEKKTNSSADSTAAIAPAAYDTALSPQSRPVTLNFITWPDSLTPQAEDLPTELEWSFFDSALTQRFTQAELNTLSREGFYVQSLPPGNVSIDDMVDRYRELVVTKSGQTYSTVPVFITSDFLLHVFHLVSDRMLQSVEEKRLLPLLEQLTANLIQGTTEQAKGAPTPFIAAAASRNASFLSVAARLLSDSVTIPDEGRSLAEWELRLVNAAEGSEISPLTGSMEDYALYSPRGHYTINKSLSRYFRTMTWYQKKLFAPGKDTLTLQALLLTRLLERPENRMLWEKLYMPAEFVNGRSDDLTTNDYSEILLDVYGAAPGLPQLSDTSRLHRFMHEAGLRVSHAADRGFRLIGKRAAPEAYIFSEVTSPRVGTGQLPRNIPTALDVMSVLGSPVADEFTHRDDAVQNYPEQMQKLKSEFREYPPPLWNSTLPLCWLNALRPLMQEKGPDYPYFMRGRKWAAKGLLTAVGSWTELNHDTFLVPQQAYPDSGGTAERDTSRPEPPPEPKGYVEPDIDFMNRMVYLADRTRTRFNGMDILPVEYEKKLGILYDDLLHLRSIVQKELLNTGITAEDYHFLLSFSENISKIILPEDAGASVEEKYKQMAIITETFTDAFPPDMKVLENGVGAPQRIYVAVKDDAGGARVCVGYVFSDYEFAENIGNHVSDEQWRTLVYTRQRKQLESKEAAWAKGLRSLPPR